MALAPRPGTATSAEPSDQQVDRATVVEQVLDALNRGDVDATVAAYTSNTLFVDGPPCGASSPCIGADAARKRFEALVQTHASFNLVGIQVLGSAVVGQFEERADNVSAAGVDRVLATFFFQVPQDKIAAQFTFVDPTDSQSATFLAFTASQQPQPAPAGR